MGQIAAAVKHLIAAGIVGDALVRAIEDMEAAVVVQQAETKPARSRAAERQARYRARKTGEGGGGVTRDACDGSDVTVTPSVTVSDAADKFSPQTPLSNFTTSLSDTREMRTQAQRDLRNRTGEIFEAVKGKVNGSADWTRANMHRVDMFIELMAPMQGEPCDFDLDIAPAIELAAAKLHQDGSKLTSWNYIKPIAIENRDRRLAGIPKAEKTNGRHERSGAVGGYANPRGRGPVEDPLDRIRARMDGRQADPDIIEHTPIAARA